MRLIEDRSDKIILFLILILSGLFIFLFLFAYVLLPSYNSTVLDCYDGDLNKKLSEMGLNVVGSTINNDGEVQINFCFDTTQKLTRNQIKTIRHEECHKRQNTKGRAFSCNLKVGVFFNEFEAYLCENFPEPIFSICGFAPKP